MLEALLATNLPTPVNVGNYALLAGGIGGGNNDGSSDKYDFDTEITVAGTSLGVNGFGWAAAGNLTRALFAGSNSNMLATRRYTYSSGAVVAGPNMGGNRYYAAAMADTNHVLIGGGYNGNSGGYLNSVDRYLFATNVLQVANYLNVSRYQPAAINNPSVGIFAAGLNGAYLKSTDKITFTNDSSSPSTSLVGAGRAALSGVGNQTQGVFGGGDNGSGVTDVWTYSNNSVVAGTALARNRANGQAAGHATLGFFFGGDGGVTSVDRYTYATNARVAATALGRGRYLGAATSTVPSGV